MTLQRSIYSAIFLFVSVAAFGQSKQMPHGKMAFTVPQAPWNFVLSADGFAVSQQKLKPDGTAGYFLMTSDKDYLTVSLWIEPAENCKTSRACRDMVYKSGNSAWGEYQDLVQSEIGDVSFFEFYRPAVQGQPVKMLDMYAEFVRDGYWIDLHISKVLYKKSDHALFEDLVKSAAFEPKAILQQAAE